MTADSRTTDEAGETPFQFVSLLAEETQQVTDPGNLPPDVPVESIPEYKAPETTAR